MEPELPPADDLPVDLPLAPSWLDAGLAGLGLPAASVAVPVVVAVALLSVALGDVIKGLAGRGADTGRERAALRALVVVTGVGLGCASSCLAMIALPQGAALGLIGGLAAPVVWRAVVPWLRARGVR